jgi:hypothetical protein
MIVSLNEIENMALKSARGSGYPWGLAEEAAQAVRWLAARRLPWCEPLLGHLERTASEPPERCPIRVGSAITDDPQTMVPAGSSVLGPIEDAMLLLPFLATAARVLAVRLAVGWHGLAFVADGEACGIEISDAAATAGVMRVTLSRQAIRQPLSPRLRRLVPVVGGVGVGEADWRRLGVLAERTYVPVSVASRQRGAGAGMIDND